jgi:hypothetical protein
VTSTLLHSCSLVQQVFGFFSSHLKAELVQLGWVQKSLEENTINAIFKNRVMSLSKNQGGVLRSISSCVKAAIEETAKGIQKDKKGFKLSMAVAHDHAVLFYMAEFRSSRRLKDRKKYFISRKCYDKIVPALKKEEWQMLKEVERETDEEMEVFSKRMYRCIQQAVFRACSIAEKVFATKSELQAAIGYEAGAKGL